MNFQNLNYKIIGSTIAAIALGVIILILCFFIGTDSKTIALNIATLVLGISVGWLIGILISLTIRRNKKNLHHMAKH